MPKYDFIENVPRHIIEKLKEYVTDPEGTTFGIVGLPSELTGGVMARYSRAPTGLVLTLINEFLDENGEPSQAKGSALMDRVLNAFGDESVGELEGAHVGIEDVSQLMTKLIEDRRIGGSPIEQSTRYVKYDQKDKDGRWRYLRPKEIMEAGLGEKFEKVNDRTFEVYSEGIKRLTDYFKRVFPREEFKVKVERDGETVQVGEDGLQSDAERRAFRIGYGFTVRCAALDVGRCVLPASTLTHLGIFGNGRFYTNLISFLKSHELEEPNARGHDLERE
ncbi:MAG: FAD-dependent thymidylate synthase, partial [Candidatus Bathyarchaeota archaeon]|nr:FAD-dependent thymidylate synthase [Candidatus Bathyarchaeota archaeon]